MINKFSESTIKALVYYVYKLVDPRDSIPFYVGKGIGNRIFNHEKDAEKDREVYTAKLNKINDIKNNGYEVERVIIKYGLTEDEAFKVECSIIDTYINDGINLTNIQGGHHSNIDTVENIEIKFAAEDLDLQKITDVPIIRINGNQAWEKSLSYEENMTRIKGTWRLNDKKIEKAKNLNAIILIEKNGLCVGTAILKDYYSSNGIPDVFGNIKENRKYLTFDITNDITYLHKRLLPLRNSGDGKGIIQYPVLYYNI